MNYVRGFAPWLCYAALSPVDWRLGTSAAALAALYLLAVQLRARTVDLLTTATCGFFVVMAAIALADPGTGLQHWICALANATLAATALASLMVRRPFTLTFARAEVPREFWDSPRFLRVNMVLTAIWATGFTLGALACAAVVDYDHSATVPLVTAQVLAFVLPFAVGGRYAARARTRAAQALA
ncbi:hypothetical protein ACIRQQ_36285 [Streptomyces fuscichromogenes]|uniref:hypothetical protein n=1 Tax=Streptomyces fuscichromogenes TaxID=1324013 RepID=UPI00381D0FCA